MVRRVLLVAALAAIVVTRIEPQLLRLPFIDRTPLAGAIGRQADRNWQQYPKFINRVRELTQPRDTIAILLPVLDWESGYSYAYYRASYFLTGRVVVPLAAADGSVHLENLRYARYVAGWRVGSLPAGYSVVWRGEGGVLLRR